jgi:hypothetical protein
MTVNRYLIRCKCISIVKYSRGGLPASQYSHGEPLLPELVLAGEGRANMNEGCAINYVKQLLITGSQSIFCPPLKKYHEMVTFFLIIGTAFG